MTPPSGRDDPGAAANPDASAPRETIDVSVNGEARRVAAGTSVAVLLRDLGLEGRPCAVEINRELVPRSEHARRTLAAGERIEIVSFVGGG